MKEKSKFKKKKHTDTSNHTPSTSLESDYCFLSVSVCSYFQQNSFIIYTGFWCLMNGLWESLTLAGQFDMVTTIPLLPPRIMGKKKNNQKNKNKKTQRK